MIKMKNGKRGIYKKKCKDCGKFFEVIPGEYPGVNVFCPTCKEARKK